MFTLTTRKIQVVAKLRVSENIFPGLQGEKTFKWFDDDLEDDVQPPQPPIPSQPTPPVGAAIFAPPPPPPPPPPAAARPDWLPAIYDIAPDAPEARPAWLPAIYELAPAPMPHPESGDPSSRHFARDHPRRTPAATLAARSAAIHTFVCQAVSHSKSHDYSITPGCAFQTMSAPVDDAFVAFHRDKNGEALHRAATSAATALAVTITADMGDLNVPKGYKHALNSPQAEYWQIAIDKELSGLLALDTWSYVRTCDLPAGSNVMNCHYIFTVKRKADESIDKFKARPPRTDRLNCD